jgi:hypothetical protein
MNAVSMPGMSRKLLSVQAAKATAGCARRPGFSLVAGRRVMSEREAKASYHSPGCYRPGGTTGPAVKPGKTTRKDGR